MLTSVCCGCAVQDASSPTAPDRAARREVGEDHSVPKSVYISRGSLRYGGAGLGSRILKSEAEVNCKQVELFEEVTCG